MTGDHERSDDAVAQPDVGGDTSAGGGSGDGGASDGGPAAARLRSGWGDDVELVAEPIRYPRSPLVALALIALVPAIGLLVLHRWSDTRADALGSDRSATELLEARLDGDLSVDGERVVRGGAADAPAEVRSAPAGRLATGLLDFRRSPDVVATAADIGALAVAVDPVLTFVDDRSCAAVSLDGVPVTSTNATLPVIPASNQKLLVALAALEVLGEESTFTTSVRAAPVVDGVVEGDVVIVGGGDPLLTSDDYPRDDPRLDVANPTSFDSLADALVAAGVTRVRGSVVGDGSRYDDEFSIDEWGEGVASVDAGPYDALLVNDALVLGRSERQEDPNVAAARELTRLLEDRGVTVDGGPTRESISDDAAPATEVIATVDSAPLVDVVSSMLLTSDNNTAEMLLKEMGVATSGEGTRAAGLDAMVAALNGLGVPMEGVSARDGSGLSSLNRVTCAAVLEVVRLAEGGPIDEALPVAGRSGTLTDEFEGSQVTGRLRAKTGTLANEPVEADPPAVKALAGYVDPPEGTSAATIEFVLIANGADISDPEVYRPLWIAIGERFATHPGGPDRTTLGPR
ncbi:D-alanyl-D-alanine carboxypeptidase/D-alanyl-D-alanine-endopeptidase [Ilumatobacter sp.]|uniref:D-alanyl-D-alanine carboxypeptidase/D-alanyl-D-alanine-endopeptidase n=1 Tax=Ilumatobacter sp. TaxID=1967498 RepID=UPI003B5231AC